MIHSLFRDTIGSESVALCFLFRLRKHFYTQSLEILPVMRMIDLKRKAARKEYAMAGGTFLLLSMPALRLVPIFYNTVFSARQLRDNIGKYVGIGISFPLLSGLERLTHQRKQKLNLYRLKNEEELEKQQLYTDIEQTLLSYMPDLVNINRHCNSLKQKLSY